MENRLVKVEASETEPRAPACGSPELDALVNRKRTILLVEDESFVRDVMDEVLQSVGYRVLKMQSAEEALEFCERSSEKLDLLLTDVVMPGRNGRDLARELRKQSPTMRTLFMSGYGENVALLDRGLDRDCHSGDSSFFRGTRVFQSIWFATSGFPLVQPGAFRIV